MNYLKDILVDHIVLIILMISLTTLTLIFKLNFSSFGAGSIAFAKDCKIFQILKCHKQKQIPACNIEKSFKLFIPIIEYYHFEQKFMQSS